MITRIVRASVVLAAAGVLLASSMAAAAPSSTGMSASPSRLNFGRLMIGDTSPTYGYITITNNTGLDQTEQSQFYDNGFVGFIISGAQPNTTSCPLLWGTSTALANGATCTIEIRYENTKVGRWHDGITINWSPDGGTTTIAQHIDLLATSVSPGDMTSTPSKLSFGRLQINNPSPVYGYLTITNNTGLDQTEQSQFYDNGFVGFIISGAQPNTTSCPLLWGSSTALANGATCTIEIRYENNTVGKWQDGITINWSPDGGSTIYAQHIAFSATTFQP